LQEGDGLRFVDGGQHALGQRRVNGWDDTWRGQLLTRHGFPRNANDLCFLYHPIAGTAAPHVSSVCLPHLEPW
jgi:hypothetical protein